MKNWFARMIWIQVLSFSGSGSSYVIGKTVATEDADWDF